MRGNLRDTYGKGLPMRLIRILAFVSVAFCCDGRNISASDVKPEETLCPLFFMSEAIRVTGCEETKTGSNWQIDVRTIAASSKDLGDVCRWLKGSEAVSGNTLIRATNTDGSTAIVRCQIDKLPKVYVERP